ncbi:30S ribosomal protein S9 [Candidatus Micrarchaeota archaeon RBG_16_36_9]|nr:MAG: 30S ribosomal protein S9 [Candidatus Micrarchaeota archaeon RBG_16_36_9]
MIIQKTGKRKKAVAKAVAKPGRGEVTINNRSLEIFQPELLKLFIKEPLILAGEVKDLDIDVSVKGGGVFGQASAARQAIAKTLVENNKSLKEVFQNYDRTLLVADARRTEAHKPSASKRGPRRHKQRSKR